MTSLYARHKRTTLAIATAVAAGALVTTGLTSGAVAAPTGADAAAKPLAAPTVLSATARTALIQDKQAEASTTAQKIGLGTKEKLVVRDVVKDADGTVHTRYERTYAGLPVLGGDLVVHESAAGATKGVTKATNTTIKVASLTPAVTTAKAEKQAVTLAKAAGSAQTSATKAPRKVIWAGNGSKPVLAYETVVGGLQDDGTPNELHVITDAATGKKLYEYQGIETGTGKSLYSGTVTLNTTLSGSTYQLTDGTRGGHKTYNKAHSSALSGTGTLFTDADDTWGTGAASSSTTDQTAAVDAAYGAQVTWDFYKNTFSRSGIKNNGVAAYSRVHFGNQYVNAFWDDDCFCMTYGDGEGNVNPLTSLDVAGHEMSHGVTANTAGLNYSGESGGLNEATSDIFGTGVEFYAANSNDPGDYLIGEEIDINGDGTPLRYMDQPSKDGGSANYWSSSVGNLDVHYSSGVANHFFYLLSEGSGSKTINGVTYNSPTYNSSTITGIGRAKALQIWYKALTTYMTSTTNYKAARTATLSAASALYGSTSTEYSTVAAAWTAVNVT
ncbi:M4 family metallopeptidase [Streptomyces sp. NPDC002588]|uniref:M4 family metallopeptidase n=1 Tax=Streptomyces sp. NPDC002588 TaxID=3154419 RepID=UPI003326EA45